MGWLGYLLLIICLVMFINYAFHEAINDEHSTIYHIFWGVPYKILFGVMLWASIILFLSKLRYDEPNIILKKYNVNIYSIGLNSSTTGNFTLGCGTVKDKIVYRFFCKNRKNGFVCNEVDADKTLLVEKESLKHPYITYISERKRIGEPNFLMKALFGDDDMWRYIYIKKGEDNIIYLPKGSIVQTYEIRP